MRGYERWLRSILKRKPAEMQQSEQLLSVWQRVPSGLRAEEQLVATYCECLAAVGEQGSASALLQQVLARSWSDRLVGLYGGLEHVSIKQSIEKAEGWLEAHPNSASLLLALGRLSMRNHQWDQAQQYFERSLAARVSVEVYGELGRLLAGRGKHEASNGYFQKGLGMLVNGLPDVPLPEPVAAD